MRRPTMWMCWHAMRASATASRNGRVMTMEMGSARCIATVVKVQAPVCARSCAHSGVSTNTIWPTMWRPAKQWRMPNGSPQRSFSGCVSATECTQRPHEPNVQAIDIFGDEPLASTSFHASPADAQLASSVPDQVKEHPMPYTHASAALSDDTAVDFVILAPLTEERNAVLAHLPDPKRLPPSDTDILVYYESRLPVTF